MIYKWREFNGQHQEYGINLNSENLVAYEVNSVSLNLQLNEIASPFVTSFSMLNIFKFNDGILKAFLDSKGLVDKLDDFRILGCAMQEKFSNSFNELLGQSGEDFSNHRRDYESLLDFLEVYLKSKDRSDYKGILFKNKSGDNLSLQNFFIVDDVYNAIMDNLGVNEMNFAKRKLEILEKTNPYNLKKNSERFKSEIINLLFNYFKDFTISGDESLRCTGAFLHIFSIPTKQNIEYVQLYTNIRVLLDFIDIKYLRHYISRPKNYHT
ncbi:hypothetical protein WNY60_13405 [Olleya sp. AS48]